MNITQTQKITNDGKVIVYEQETVKGTKIYKIVEINKNSPYEPQTQVTICSKFGNHELSAQDALNLYEGKAIIHAFDTKNGEKSMGYLAGKNISLKINEKEGKTYENRYLELGIAFPIVNKDEMKEIGYKVDGVAYFRKVRVAGKEDRHVELEASDCIRLSSGSSVYKDWVSLNVKEIEAQQITSATNPDKEYTTKKALITAFDKNPQVHVERENKTLAYSA